MKRAARLAVVETATTIVWFAMDACWMLDSRFLALTLALPTVLLSLLVFRFLKRTPASWLVSGSMASWACMNVLWMSHDLGVFRWGLTAGKVLLALGIALLGAAFVVGGSEALTLVTARVRRLRLRA